MASLAYIGTGHNPSSPDLPLGSGMQLAQSPKAMNAFASMANGQRSTVINSFKGAATGEEAKNKMAGALSKLQSGNIQF